MIGGERQALTTALGVWLAAVAAMALGAQDPWWAAISAWMIANPDRDALLLKSVLRFFGTVIGCVIGYNAGLMLEGQPVGQALFLFAVNMFGMLMRFRSRFFYAWLLAAITIDMAMVGSIQSPATLYSFVIMRGSEITIGIVAGLAAALVLGRDVHGPPAKPPPPAPSRMEEFHAAIIAGLMPLAILCAWSLFDLPSLLQIMVTVGAIFDRDIVAMRVKGGQRLLGCMLGGSIGLAAVAFGLDAFVPWSLVFLAALIALAHIHHGRHSNTYVGTQGGLALILAMVTGAGAPDTIAPVVERIAGMVCGVVLLLVVVTVMRPVLERLLPLRPDPAPPSAAL